MDLKILLLSRVAPWILAWIGHMVLASDSRLPSMMASHLTDFCGAFFCFTIVVTIFALIDRAHPRLKCL